LDVRKPHERAASRILGSRHVPLAEVVGRMDELDPSREWVVYCRLGGRSARAIEVLRAAGYAGPLRNLTGGIEAWTADAGAGTR
ncbi:MAG: rhodanese-like domain-containing protein, partial [bacterium]